MKLHSLCRSRSPVISAGLAAALVFAACGDEDKPGARDSGTDAGGASNDASKDIDSGAPEAGTDAGGVGTDAGQSGAGAGASADSGGVQPQDAEVSEPDTGTRADAGPVDASPLADARSLDANASPTDSATDASLDPSLDASSTLDSGSSAEQCSLEPSWLKCAGGDNPATVTVNALAVAGSTVAVTGTYAGSPDFEGSDLDSAGHYLLGYNLSGERSFLTELTAAVTDMTTNSAGQWVITGTLTDDSTEPPLLHLETAGFTNSFVATYSEAGTFVAGKVFGGVENSAQTIAADGDGHVLITGSGNITFPDCPLAQGGYWYARLNAAGDCVYSGRLVGVVANTSLAGAMDSAGNAYLGGRFSGELTVGDQTFIGDGDAATTFLFKLNTAGVPQWAKVFTTVVPAPIIFRGVDVEAEPDGDVYLSGSVGPDNQLNFGGENLGLGGKFVAKFDTDGNPIWSSRFGDPDDAWGSTLRVSSSPDGSAYVFGSFTGTFSLTTPATSATGSDLFLLKYSASGALLQASAFTGAGTQTAAALAVIGDCDLLLAGTYTNPFSVGSQTTTCLGADQPDAFFARLPGE